MNGNTIPDTLQHLRPRTSQVIVGDVLLSLRTPTLAQVGALQKVISQLDLTALLNHISGLTAAAPNTASFAEALKSSLPGIFRDLLTQVGPQTFELIAECVAELLDNAKNVKACRSSGGLDDAESLDGVHLESPSFRGFVMEELTIPQTEYVITEAMRLSNSDALGKLVKGLLGQISTLTPQEAQEEQTTH